MSHQPHVRESAGATRTRVSKSRGLPTNAADYPGVDQGTLARWEHGEREPQGTLLDQVKRFLQDEEATGAPRAGSGQPNLPHAIQNSPLGGTGVLRPSESGETFATLPVVRVEPS